MLQMINTYILKTVDIKKEENNNNVSGISEYNNMKKVVKLIILLI